MIMEVAACRVLQKMHTLIPAITNRVKITISQARRHVFKSGPAVFRASAEGTSGVVEHERDVAPLVRGVRAISPEKSFDMWLPLFAF